MSQYARMDALILLAVKNRRHPLYDVECVCESKKLAQQTGREDFRVIDLRLQAMRKVGLIKYLTKAESNGQAGWHLA